MSTIIEEDFYLERALALAHQQAEKKKLIDGTVLIAANGQVVTSLEPKKTERRWQKMLNTREIATETSTVYNAVMHAFTLELSETTTTA